MASYRSFDPKELRAAVAVPRHGALAVSSTRRARTFAVLLCAGVLAQPALASAESAEARTVALLETFQRVHEAPAEGRLEPALQAENQATFSELDAFLDIERFVEKTIAPSKDAFAPDELEHFRTTFASVVRLVAYPDSGTFLRKARTKTTVEAAQGPVHPVRVDMVVPDEDLEVAVTFLWVERDDGVLVVRDVLFDGESLILEYQNQFKRIIAKDGVVGLLEKLDKKHREVQQRLGS